VPGHVEAKLRKGLDSDADALMVDLEDGVPPNDADKREGRATVTRMLSGTERDVVLRTNEVDTPWFVEDVRAAVDLGLSGIVLPKARTLSDLEQANAAIDAAGAPEAFEMWVIVESPSLLLEVERAPRLPSHASALVAGLVDLSLELTPHAFLSPAGFDDPVAQPRFEHLRLRILIAARGAGCQAVDPLIVPAVTDAEQASEAARLSRGSGFDSVIVLHPAQIEAANLAYSPTEEELDRAAAIIRAGDEAAISGRTSALVDGRVVLPQHVKAARQLVGRATLATG
jgi:citrate lyase subunit beta/citryl-CoA lyase